MPRVMFESSKRFPLAHRLFRSRGVVRVRSEVNPYSSGGVVDWTLNLAFGVVGFVPMVLALYFLQGWPRYAALGVLFIVTVGGAVSWMLWRQLRRLLRRFDAGACPMCGYDARGLLSARVFRCPECASVVEMVEGRVFPTEGRR